MTQKAFISNRTPLPLEVTIEPIARSFNIPTGDTAEISAEIIDKFDRLEIIFYNDNAVSISAFGNITIKLTDMELHWP